MFVDFANICLTYKCVRCSVLFMDTTNALVSRTLTNGKQLTVKVVDAKIVATLDGEPTSYCMVRQLPSPQSTPWGVATHGLGDAGGLKIALSQTEGEAVLSAVREQTPKPRNPPCRRCGTHCYGDCTAN